MLVLMILLKFDWLSFSLCIVLLLPSRFNDSVLEWFYNFLKYLKLCSVVGLHGS